MLTNTRLAKDTSLVSSNDQPIDFAQPIIAALKYLRGSVTILLRMDDLVNRINSLTH